MATAVTHAVFSLTLGKTSIQGKMPWRFWILLIICSILPDLDVIGFYLGFRYRDFLGHRGFSHSLLFAFLLSLLVAESGRNDQARFSKSWWRLCLFCFLIIATHGVLDAMTNGGLGVAFFSPIDPTRYFLPWTPLIVSPIGVSAFFSPWGKEVIISEIRWVWIPGFLLLLAIKGCQKLLSLRRKSADARYHIR